MQAWQQRMCRYNWTNPKLKGEWGIENKNGNFANFIIVNVTQNYGNVVERLPFDKSFLWIKLLLCRIEYSGSNNFFPFWVNKTEWGKREIDKELFYSLWMCGGAKDWEWTL